MESIGSNPHLNPTHLSPQSQPKPAKPEQESPTAKSSIDAIDGQQPSGSDFSSVFGDDELSRLQNNLERIASLAESALQRIDG